MITNEQIKQTINDCAKAGHHIGVRDISYALLCLHYEDGLLAYRSLFGNDDDYNQDYQPTYDQTAAMQYLKTYVEVSLLNEGKKRHKTEDISFEENKEYMLKLKKQTEEAMAANEIDKKDGLKILTDISCKLNDKFKVNSEEKAQVVYVTQKYDAICPVCGSEVARRPITKDEAMEMYDLYEKETKIT